MAARVQLIVEASDATGGVFRALTSQMGAFGGLVEEVTSKNRNWGNIGQMAAQMVIDGVKDAVKATTEYAREVRDLSLASGQSAEEASRMLQVLDDYQLTAEDAKTATRALTKEGLAPTVETIAKLSAEYQKLNSAEERNAFVQKNLGRAGQEWLNLLNQGPDAIRAMNDAVSEGLILTDANVLAAEEYRLALDEWNDSVEALKISIGTGLLPVLTDLINRDPSQAMQRAAEATGVAAQAAQIMADKYASSLTPATDEQIRAWRESEQATYAAAASTAELAEQEKAEAEAKKLMNQENTMFLGVLGQVTSAQTTYYEGLAAAKAALDEGKISTQEHAAQVQQLSADYQAASQQIVLSIVEMKLASDGWTDAEISAYLKVGMQMGKFTQDQVNMAEGAVAMADSIVAGFDTMEGPMLHVGERAEDNADAFGEMADAGAELGESLRKEVGAGAAAATSALNSIPKQVDVNVDIWIRKHGGGFSDDFLDLNPTAPLCFVAGTLVTLADGTRKPIEQIQGGDNVRSYDTVAGKFTVGIVTHTMTRRAGGYLNIDGLLVTSEHPIWLVNRQEFVHARDIQVGDILLRDNGRERDVQFIFSVPVEADVYNLTVESDHTYFAGGVLVHNKLQQGGEVYAGVPTTINEAGKEVFVPKTDGRILGHAESLHALSMSGGMGGSRYGPFYGPVQINTGGDAEGIMGLR